MPYSQVVNSGVRAKLIASHVPVPHAMIDTEKLKNGEILLWHRKSALTGCNAAKADSAQWQVWADIRSELLASDAATITTDCETMHTSDQNPFNRRGLCI